MIYIIQPEGKQPHICNHHVGAWKTLAADLIYVPNLLSFHVLKGLIVKQKNLYLKKKFLVSACQGLSRACAQSLGVNLSNTFVVGNVRQGIFLILKTNFIS